MLAALVLTLHDEARGHVRDADGAFGLVDMLAARAAAPVGVYHKVGGVDGDIDILSLGQHRHGRRACVDAPLRLGLGHALHAVHAALILHARVRAAPREAQHDLLHSAHLGVAFVHQLALKAVPLGVALIHAQKVRAEKRRLLAARARANFDHHIPLIVGVFGQQHEPEPVLYFSFLFGKGKKLLADELLHLRLVRLGKHAPAFRRSAGRGGIFIVSVNDIRNARVLASELPEP